MAISRILTTETAEKNQETRIGEKTAEISTNNKVEISTKTTEITTNLIIEIITNLMVEITTKNLQVSTKMSGTRTDPGISATILFLIKRNLTEKGNQAKEATNSFSIRKTENLLKLILPRKKPRLTKG